MMYLILFVCIIPDIYMCIYIYIEYVTDVDTQAAHVDKVVSI
jgi:hypothetical protein